MLNNNFALRFTITTLLLIAAFLFGSCRADGLPPTSADGSSKSSALTLENLSTGNRQNPTAVNANTNSSREISQTAKIQSPSQVKARRAKIEFPADCHYLPNNSDSEWRLQLTCAQTLDVILPQLPEADCQYESFRKKGGRFQMIVDDERLLNYTVQEKDMGDLTALAENLGTTEDSIILNNKFHNQGKLVVGQEISYQKSHLEKSSTSWFDDYDIEFYPLMPNKYLVKVRCIAGAYNELNAYALYDESAIPAQARVLEFPSLEIIHDEDSDSAKAVNPITVKTVGGRYFDSQTKKLIVFSKAHGIGDAGSYARYSFSDGEPKLEEYRAKFVWNGPEYTLDDVIKNPPKTWKRFYP